MAIPPVALPAQTLCREGVIPLCATHQKPSAAPKNAQTATEVAISGPFESGVGEGPSAIKHGMGLILAGAWVAHPSLPRTSTPQMQIKPPLAHWLKIVAFYNHFLQNVFSPFTVVLFCSVLHGYICLMFLIGGF